jgi:hypothetical protein
VRPRSSQIIPLIVCGVILLGGTAVAGEKCDKIIEKFIVSNTRISRDYPDPMERQKLLNTALKELVRNARAVYGPFCSCDELLNSAAALQKHREAWRSPPPGWDPYRFRATNLPLEVEIAREDVRLLMALVTLCNTH